MDFQSIECLCWPSDTVCQSRALSRVFPPRSRLKNVARPIQVTPVSRQRTVRSRVTPSKLTNSNFPNRVPNLNSFVPELHSSYRRQCLTSISIPYRNWKPEKNSFLLAIRRNSYIIENSGSIILLLCSTSIFVHKCAVNDTILGVVCKWIPPIDPETIGPEFSSAILN